MLFCIIIVQQFFLDSVERLTDPPAVLVSNLFLVLLLLTMYFSHRFLLARSGFICFMELILLSTATALGVTRLFSVVYILIAMRFGLTMPFRTYLPFGLAAFALFCAAKESRYFLIEKAVFALSPLKHLVHVLIFGRLANFGLAIAFALMCAAAVVTEQRARLAREQLNQQVESMAKQLERSRLAREIHDTVGHSLTALNMQLEYALKCLRKAPHLTATALDKIRSLTIQSRKDLQVAISSHEESNIDLKRALILLIDDYHDQQIFEIQLKFDIPPLHRFAEHEIFSIIKEALNNAKKYAAASCVQITLSASETILWAEIADDGEGFDMSEVKPTSYGIKGMTERAQALGAKLEVTSSPQRGTSIMLSVVLLEVIEKAVESVH